MAEAAHTTVSLFGGGSAHKGIIRQQSGMERRSALTGDVRGGRFGREEDLLVVVVVGRWNDSSTSRKGGRCFVALKIVPCRWTRLHPSIVRG